MKFYVVAFALCFAVIGTSALKCYMYCKGEECEENAQDLNEVECKKDEIACTSYKYFDHDIEFKRCTKFKDCESAGNYKCNDCDTDLCNKELLGDKKENDD